MTSNFTIKTTEDLVEKLIAAGLDAQITIPHREDRDAEITLEPHPDTGTPIRLTYNESSGDAIIWMGDDELCKDGDVVLGDDEETSEDFARLVAKIKKVRDEIDSETE